MNNDYTLKEANLMPEGKCPLEMERNALKSAIEGKVNRLQMKAYGHNLGIGTQKLRPALNLFNIYGRIVFKERKDCAHYYVLLNENRKKTDCWLNSQLTHEK